MNLRRSVSTAFMVLFAVTRFGLAQIQPEALDILRKVGETYQSMKTLQAEGDVQIATTGQDMQQTMKTQMVLTMASNKMRLEAKGGATNVLVVFDGQTVWLMMPQLNKYSKLTVSKLGAGGKAADLGALPGLNGFQAQFAHVADDIEEARILRSESLEEDGVDADCYVIEVAHKQPSEPLTGTTAKIEVGGETLWVEKSRLLVRRLTSDTKTTLSGSSNAMEMKSTITFKKVRLDDPVPDDAFVFEPPPGATELDLTQFLPKDATAPK